MTKYRLYVDEVGNADLGASRDPNHRYLSLTGVILDFDYVAEVAAPRIDKLKHDHFGGHPDAPVVLHRKELVNKKPPFHTLLDPAKCAAFDADLLQLVDDLACVVITVVIDKLDHLRRYKVWQQDPYHYCLTALLERYVMWLYGQKAVGDVMTESRGKKEDLSLKRLYRYVFEQGTQFMPARHFATRLTSRELKVSPKQANITGLQLADILAHPSLAATAARVSGNPLPPNFGGHIAAILERTKYNRAADGWIWGRGRVWIPSSARPKKPLLVSAAAQVVP